MIVSVAAMMPRTVGTDEAEAAVSVRVSRIVVRLCSVNGRLLISCRAGHCRFSRRHFFGAKPREPLIERFLLPFEPRDRLGIRGTGTDVDDGAVRAREVLISHALAGFLTAIDRRRGGRRRCEGGKEQRGYKKRKNVR